MKRNLLLLFLALILTTGCSSITDATIPAEQTSVQQAMPDTIEVERMPRATLDGRHTQPVEVRTSSEPEPAPTSDVESVEVDRAEETVTVRSRSDTTATEQVFKLPVFGERLTLLSDSSVFTGRVQGEPQEQTVEVYDTSSSWPQWMIAVASILGLLVLLRVMR